MKIKPVIYLGIIAVVLLGLFFVFQSKTQQQVQNTQKSQQTIVATVTIVMKPDAFEPNSLTVQKNTKVIFKNEDSKPHWPASDVHPIHSIYPEFDPRQGIESGKEWSFIFDKVGNWRFHDHLSPSLRGEIKVVETLDK